MLSLVIWLVSVVLVFLAGVSGELKHIIRGMMEPDPTKRPAINQILEHQYVEQVGLTLSVDIQAKFKIEFAWFNLRISLYPQIFSLEVCIVSAAVDHVNLK